MEIYERKNKVNPQTTPRSRSTMFPSLRGDFDWWKDRSRSPLSFPSKRCKNYGRKGGGRASFQGQQWRKESAQSWLKEEEGVFTPPPKM
jgi:hypothetical protein